MAKQRDKTLDIARGVAIVGLLYGHGIALMNHIDWMFHWIWSFHMPMFALVAGYFYREKTFFQTLWSGVKTLLLPCLCISLILLLSDEISGGVNNCKSLLYEWIYRTFLVFTFQYAPCGFWFVVALFNGRMILSLTSKLKNKYTNVVLAIISLIIVFCLPHIEAYQFTTTFALLIFMIIGIYTRQFDVLSRPKSLIELLLLFGVFISGGWLHIAVVSSHYPLGVLNIVTATAICYAIIRYCQILEQSDNKVVRPVKQHLAFCGQHSMIILFIQAFFIYAKRFPSFITNSTGITNPYAMMLLFMLSCIACTFVVTKINISVRKVVETKKQNHGHIKN